MTQKQHTPNWAIKLLVPEDVPTVKNLALKARTPTIQFVTVLNIIDLKSLLQNYF